MINLKYNCSLVILIALFSCNQQNADERLNDANTISETIANPGNGEIEEDSTLQPVEDITLKATGNKIDEIAFSKDTIKVPAGALVRIEFINEGSEQPMIHNFVIAEEGSFKVVALEGVKAGASGNYIPADRKLLAASPLALPGQTVQIQFEAPLTPGTYDFVCTYPDHWKRMNGKLIVK
jgi:azurin